MAQAHVTRVGTRDPVPAPVRHAVHDAEVAATGGVVDVRGTRCKRERLDREGPKYISKIQGDPKVTNNFKNQ